MKVHGSLFFLFVAAISVVPDAHASPAPDFCKILRAFVLAVQPDETHEFMFRTSWGSNFKDATEPVMFAKRCEHGGYAPAEKACAYLLEHGSAEFTGGIVKDAVSCLSRKTKFDHGLRLNVADFHFSYGSEDRGALIDVTFKPDSEVGGMSFRLAANGY